MDGNFCKKKRDSIEYFNMIFIKPLFLCFSGNGPRAGVYSIYV